MNSCFVCTRCNVMRCICVAVVTLGRILFDKNDFDEAVVHLESGLSILREELPTSHFTAKGTNILHWCCYLYLCLNHTFTIVLIAGLYYLARIEMERNQLIDAQRHATQCLRLRQEIFLKDDSNIICGRKVSH